MATVGALNVILSASSAAFTSGLKKARTELTGFTGFVNISSGLITKALAFAGIGAGTAGLAALVNHSMEAIDATGKLSDRLGIATESLVGLQHAAALAGVSNEELTLGIEKMLKNLPAGTGSVEDAFKAVADQLKAIDDPFKRAQLAVDIFGKSGQRLLPLLMQGAEGIKAAKDEAEKLGITFNRVDAARVEEANDAMTKLKEAFGGLANTAAIALAPALTKITNILTSIVSGVGKLLALPGKVSSFLAGRGFNAATELQAMSDAAKQAQKSAEDMKPAIDAAATSAKALSQAWDPTRNFSGFDPEGDSRKAIQDIINGLMDERRELILTQREILQQKLQQQGADAATQLQTLGIYDQIEAIKARRKAEEDAAKATQSALANQDRAANDQELKLTNAFAGAVERRHTFSFTTPESVASDRDREKEKLAEAKRQTTEQKKHSALLDLINQKLGNSDSLGLLTLN